MYSWIQKIARGYLGVSRNNDVERSLTWTPWTVKPSHLWSPRQSKEPCDPVTCSECPGGDRCCKYTTPSHPAGQSTYVTYDDDGYPAHRRR